MPNLTRKISQHNSKVSREARMEENINNNQVPQQEQELPCNCDFVRLEIDECPLLGRCRAEVDIVYSAKVTRMDDNTYETYGGMHKGPFKGRWYGHRSNIKTKGRGARPNWQLTYGT